MLLLKNLRLMLFLIILAVIDCAQCADRATHTRLLSDLLVNYGSPFTRPGTNDSHTVHVGFRFAPVMTALDETTQELQVRGMFLLTWNDDRLTWNATDYEGLVQINVPLFEDGVGKPSIWKPELVLYESVGVSFESFHHDTKAVTVNYTGDVHWYTLATTKSSCSVIARYYPFDKQTCELTFTTWLYQTDEQMFYVVSDILEDNTYRSYEIANALWNVAVQTAQVGNASYECITCTGQEQSFVYYKLILTRGQHGLYFFNVILPCLVMSAMTLIVIWLPPRDVAGAAGLGVTCILAFFVFQGFLFTQLPATGMPLIGDYIVWLIAEATVVTVYAVYRATREQKKVESNDTPEATKDKQHDNTTNNGADSTDGDVSVKEEIEEQDNENRLPSEITIIKGSTKGDTDTDQGPDQQTQQTPKENVSADQEESKKKGNRNNVQSDVESQSNDSLSSSNVQRRERSSTNGDAESGKISQNFTSENEIKSKGDISENSESIKLPSTSGQNSPDTYSNDRIMERTDEKDAKITTQQHTQGKQASQEGQPKCGVFKYLENLRNDFESSEKLTKAMIYIKATTTVVFIVILLFYIGA